MAYADDVTALSTDHLWEFDGDLVDAIGTADGTNTGGILTENGICEDATNCWSSDTIVDDRIDLGDVSDISNGEHTYKAVGGWFETTKIQPHPCRIYGEGTNTVTFQFVMAMGNNLMLEVVDGDGVAQVFGISLVPNRKYHLLGLLSNGTLELFVDGISQGTATGYGNTLSARNSAEFGDPTGTVGVGGDVVLLQAPVNGRYNYWATWETTIIDATEIREILFAKGALAEIEISSQSNLDNYSNTEISNLPLAFNIIGTNLDLTADNIIFDDKCSLHIRWEGTGILNWTNINGSTASTYVATNDGTVNIINPVTFTINGLIAGSQVSIYNDEITNLENFDTRLQYTASSDTSVNYSHNGTSNTIVITVIKDGYEEVIITYPLGASNSILTVTQELETN